MASLDKFLTINLLSLLAFFILFVFPHPSDSLTCNSQTFTNKQTFDHCLDLPYLNSYLHWTYSKVNSSLSIAFTASPPKSGGWVAWGINPTGTGMLGTQALIAYRLPNGSTVVNTYNISSFNVVQSPISFPVSGLSAQYSGGNITLSGTWVLPGKPKELNQVWQVGPAVLPDGSPTKHNMLAENRNSVGTLSLVASSGPTGSPPASSPNSPAPGSGSGNSTGGASPPSDAGESLLVKSAGWGLMLMFCSVLRFLF